MIQNTQGTAGMPNERRYCVWQCPTHETNQKPMGVTPKNGCKLWQFRKANPTMRSQGKCTKCGKKPRLSEGNYSHSFSLNEEGKLNAKSMVDVLNRAEAEKWY